MRRLAHYALFLGTIVAIPLLQACSGEQVEANPPAGAAEVAAGTTTEAAPVGLARAEFAVAGMDCGGCVLGTRAALRKIEGVQQADASYDEATSRGSAWALYDPAKVTPERMMAAIRELGYTPTLAEAAR